MSQVIQQEAGKLKVPVAENACAFHVNAIDNVCSDKFTLEKMKEFIAQLKGPNAVSEKADPSKVVDVAKQVTNCDSEACLLKNPQFSQFIGAVQADEVLKDRFKPSGPANSTEWLNNDNIDYVLDQWAKKYPGFINVPFQMIDFDVVGTELSRVDLVSVYESGSRKLGCIINTDKSTGRGIHWFCIFIDMSDTNKWTLEYFDSAGEYPKSSVHKWLNTQRAKLAAKYPDKDIQVIDVTRSNQLQKSATECGVFSLWYILSRLNNIPYTYFSQPNASTDDMMYQFRKFLFRHDMKAGGKRSRKK